MLNYRNAIKKYASLLVTSCDEDNETAKYFVRFTQNKKVTFFKQYAVNDSGRKPMRLL